MENNSNPRLHGSDRATAFQRVFGAEIKKIREARGLKRTEVAARMGYTNLSKGSSRLASWERGACFPCEDRSARLVEALELPEDFMTRQRAAHQRLTTTADSELGTLHNADRDATQRELEALIRHLPLLQAGYQGAHGPLQDEHNTLVHGAKLILAYLGGRTLSVRELLEFWSHDHLTLPCEHCSGLFRVVHVAGSPLSGAHQLYGFCEGDGTLRPGNLPKGTTLLSFARPVLKRTPASFPPPGAWNLEQIAANLGGHVQPVKIHDAQGDLWAKYEYRDQLLLNPAGHVIAQFGQPCPQDTPHESTQSRWQDQHGPTHHKGIPVVGSLSPFKGGAWRGTCLEITSGQPEPWRAHRGWLQNPGGYPELVFDGTLPPVVLVHIARLRSQPI